MDAPDQHHHCPDTDARFSLRSLPKSASWQDLKDHMRKAGDVTFAQVMLPYMVAPCSPCTFTKFTAEHVSQHLAA